MKTKSAKKVRHVIEFGTKQTEYEGKTILLPSKILRTKLCDEVLIGFKMVLVLGKIHYTIQSGTCISRCRR